MFRSRAGADPYVFYKIGHVHHVETAWRLSEDLGLYEALREAPATVEQVCTRTGLKKRPAAALLAANACMGICGLKDGRYFIHDIMREFVLEGGRSRVRPDVPAPAEDKHYDAIRQSYLTDQPAPDFISIWRKHPHAAPGVRAFSPERHGWRILWGEALAEAFDFSPYHLIADLGGATGGVLVGLTATYPNLRGVVVELPYSRESAEAAIRSSGTSDRVSFYEADFFTDPYPAGVDVFFMSHVIHDWDDERCLAILRRCHEALPSGCPILVQEFLLNEDKTGPYLAVFQWINLIYRNPGDQRTSEEIADLMMKAGFRNMETRPIDPEQSLVVGWKN